MVRKRLPWFQWTFCEGKTRLRFLAFSQELSLANELCFMFLVMLWPKKYGKLIGEGNLATVIPRK